MRDLLLEHLAHMGLLSRDSGDTWDFGQWTYGYLVGHLGLVEGTPVYLRGHFGLDKGTLVYLRGYLGHNKGTPGYLR